MKHPPIPDAALQQHIAVLGKTRSGKSSVMRGLAEGLLHRQLPVCIVDPKGDWWGIKLGADGKRAGYPVVIFGGEHADVPIDARAGGQVAELYATGNRPCLIDLGGWMPGERTRFWIDFASSLFRHTRGTRWLVVDEVHNFAPKGKVMDPDSGKALHWANRLASEGLGKGLHMIFASQRPQKVHNDTLTSAETLIAMRVLHPSDREAVADWIKGCGDLKLGNEVLASLAQMKRGEGWAWSPEIGFGPERIQFPMFETYDSFKPQTAADVKSLKGWAEVDLEDVKKKLAVFVEEAKANDPKELRLKIAALQKELAAKPTALGEASKEELANAGAEGWQDGHRTGLAEAWRAIGARTIHRFASLDEHLKEAGAIAETMRLEIAKEIERGPVAATTRPASPPPTPRVATVLTPQRPTGRPNGHISSTPAGDLPPTLQRVVNAIGWWRQIGHDPVERSRACVVAGYSPRASTFGVYIGDLVKRGLVETSPGRVALTVGGVAIAQVPAGDTREQIHDVARELLKPQEQRVFDAVYDSYPAEIARRDLAEIVGLSPTASTLGVYIGGIAAYGIIETSSPGHVRAAGWLFP